MSQQQLMMWPFNTPILVEERDASDAEFKHFHLIDQWRYLGRIEDEEDLRSRGYASQLTKQPTSESANQSTNQSENQASGETCAITSVAQDDGKSIDPACDANFDLDIYHILLRFLIKPEQLRINQLIVHPLQRVSDHFDNATDD
jgi:hypothetical protein